MEKTTEKIPTWSLCYLVNGDASGLTDEEIRTIDRWYKDMGAQTVSPVMDDECNLQPYFSHCPAFGLPTEVVDCDILFYPTYQKMTTMKGTEHFKQAIKSYLDERAKTDELFAVAYAKENKNLDDCVTFILNQVKALANEGCAGMTDNEVYSLACHYFDEDDIEIGKPVNCGVIVNRHIELTEEEKSRGKAEGYQPIPSRGTAQDATTQEQTNGKTTGHQIYRT